jgi:hypothetical protein
MGVILNSGIAKILKKELILNITPTRNNVSTVRGS